MEGEKLNVDISRESPGDSSIIITGYTSRVRKMIEERVLECLPPDDLIKFDNLLDIYHSYRAHLQYMEQYDGIRKRFCEKYERKLELIFKKKQIPGWHRFLRDLFYSSVDEKFQKFFKNLDMNKLFEENRGEIVDIDSGDNTEVTNREDFQKKLIEMLKSKFPNAGKNLYHILKSKNFFQEVNKEFYKLFLDKFKQDFEPCYIKLENSVIGDIMLPPIEMEFMVKHLSMIDDNNSDFFKGYVQILTIYAFYKFLLSEKRKKIDNETSKNDPIDNILNTVDLSCFDNSSKKITEENLETIQEIQRFLFPLDEKKQKNFGKYLTRLFTNGKDIRISSIRNKFGLFEIPKNVEELLNKLNINVIYDETTEEQEGQNGDNQVVSDYNKPIQNVESNTQTIEDINDDPMTVLEKQIITKKYSYEIRNANELRKQFQKICTTPYLRKIVCDTIKGAKFGNPLKKYHPRFNYWSLEVEGSSGLRFLLLKDDKTYYIEGFYTHGEYEKRLKNNR